MSKTRTRGLVLVAPPGHGQHQPLARIGTTRSNDGHSRADS